MQPIGEDEYHVLLKLANDQFLKSVKERKRAEKSTIIRFWRTKGKSTIETGGKILLYDNNRASFLIHFS